MSGEAKAASGHPLAALEDSAQLLLVIAADWDATSAELRCFERTHRGAAWAEVLAVPQVVIGRNGLGWGLGLHSSPAGARPEKREGDGKAPAGAFRLVEAFGYGTDTDAGVKNFPYRELTERIEGVDDPRSQHYNRLIDAATVPTKDWNSSERMRRSGERYRWGVVVAHNWNQVPARGSCIFIHVWPGGGGGTAGCTALPAEQMLALVRWLDRRKNPVLVQLPRGEYLAVRDRWKLP